ncbi:VTT domain-containing protein [Paenalkalicoccus suaedae]|uniref:TVP38/TMEM64 family membrane protein n=1 Tax=Paenalkalicoccus suaedae TaxID=2592382 RepID=A0A859FGG9_9BACI|nr:VTT domain-containing protein [Paenalkalicoccus suaedae]QKS71326.1 VTT domain-containing protein [Paenalkalicoccus suaedae]
MKKYMILLLCVVTVAVLITQWDTISELRSEDATVLADSLFDRYGYWMLLLTITLTIIQNVITIFPILIIITIHFLVFDVTTAFIATAIATTIGASVCYLLAKYAGQRFVERFWQKRQETANRVVELLTTYGVLMLIILRSLPFMPSNVISVAAAVTPMRTSTYMIGSALGNISMVWLLSLLVAPLWAESFTSYLISYIICITLLLLATTVAVLRKKRRSGSV